MASHNSPPSVSRSVGAAAMMLILLGLAEAAVATGAHAQAVPPAAHGPALPVPASTVAPLLAPPLPRVLPPGQPEIVPLAPPPSEAPLVPPSGGPIRVDQVRVQGVTVYPPASLRPLYAGVIGKPSPRARFDQIVQALQTRYRADGYILTLVRGEFEKSGTQLVFVVRATEGFIGDVKLDGNIGPSGELVLRMLRHLLEPRPVNNSDLERWLLLANDIPGVTVRAVLRRQRGSAPGAVELVAEVSRREVSGLLSFDNRGPPEAGPPEMLLSGSTNSFTNFGERLTAMLFTTFNREQIFGQLNGDMFIGSSGLRAHAYWGRGNTMPGGILAGTGFDGELEIGGTALSYPWVRSRQLNLSSDVDLDAYRSTIALAGSAQGSDLWIGRLGGHLDFQDAWLLQQLAANSFDVKLSHGMVGTVSANLRQGSDAHFTKMTGELTRLQDLFTFGNVHTALKSSIGGQYTGDVLPPSEQFFLGGIQFGRGFYNGQVVGDRAIGASLELQLNTGFTNVPFLNPGYRLPAQFYGFWDYGHSFNVAPPASAAAPAPAEPDFTIQSVGVGVRSELTPWAFLELEGVHRLTVRPQGPTVPVEGAYAFFTRVTLHY